MGNEQVPVPEHPPPLQPVKVEPVAAAAVRTTGTAKGAEQVGLQLMPAGLLVTVPLPMIVTVRTGVAALTGVKGRNARRRVITASMHNNLYFDLRRNIKRKKFRFIVNPPDSIDAIQKLVFRSIGPINFY
jgi:hypothetical protein